MDKPSQSANFPRDFTMIAPQTYSRPSDAANANQDCAKILRALVIIPSEKTTDLGCWLAIVKIKACKREHAQENPVVRTMVFVPELGGYVAVYDAMAQNLCNENCQRQGSP
jgi:hypothetical protein